MEYNASIRGARWARALTLTLCVGLLAPSVIAGVTRTQTITLNKGWNAVFLEVEPANTSPDAVFAQQPIDVVASHFGNTTPLQFLSDPSLVNFKKTGWGIWYAPDRPDSFLKSLHAVYGQRAYLVHATSAFQWQVSGAVIPAVAKWRADEFNLVGFGVSTSTPPTFGQFFAGSPAHAHNRIYRLEGQSWKRVQTPAAAPMRSGEAFWIFSKGHSKFEGPVAVGANSQKGVLMGSSPAMVKIESQSSHPLEVTVEHVVSGPNPVPLAMRFQVYDGEKGGIHPLSGKFADGGWHLQLPTLEAGAKFGVPLESRREDMTESVQSSLLKITTDLGTETWLPMAATRSDLEQPSGQ